MTRTKLAGLQASGGRFVDVTFAECRLDFAAFAGVTFKNVTFDACRMHVTDFSTMTFDRVAFLHCDLSRATFATTRIERSEMRGCTLAGLRGLANLRGMAIAWNDILAHAELFAAELGIEIL